ncbi:MAG TPA: RluA family pseudouridine synthase [bacterium]|nr:RluA family pseudouridine synthase [bacterium]
MIEKERNQAIDHLKIVVPPKRTDGDRVDKYLSRSLPKISRSRLQKLIEAGRVRVNNHPVKSSYSIAPGDVIEVEIPKRPEPKVEPEPIPLDSIYEDSRMIAVNKPAGIVVHPGVGNSTGTLVNALLYHTKKLAETDSELRPGLVHRLDKDTSGIILAAKDEETHRRLSKQFEDRTVEKEYRAWVWGRPEPEERTIQRAISRHPRDRKTFATSPSGKRAVTHYEILEDHEIVTFIRLRIETGRTHQIRVHLKSIGYPVVGDPVYNGRTKRLKMLSVADREWGAKILEIMKRQALHAYRIGFHHPWTGKWMELEAALPGDFLRLEVLIAKREQVLYGI